MNVFPFSFLFIALPVVCVHVHVSAQIVIDRKGMVLLLAFRVLEQLRY